ncbi:MAG: Flp pilus assembly protein CpaB [Actinomycetota bacterium]
MSSRSRRPGTVARFRPGLALRRDPRLWWAVVLTTALVTGWIVADSIAGAQEARDQWGSTTSVVVASRAVRTGEVIEPGDVSTERWPRALVPDSALTELPPGATATAPIVAGELLVAERLAPQGLSGVAALLPAGTRAVAIPTEPGLAPPLAVGDRVDVLVALPIELAGDGPPGFAVVTGAVVVDTSDAAVTVAVPRDSAPRVAVALGQGAVSLALVGA